MKADRSGTPSEQARFNAGWLTAGQANRARKTGAVPGSHSCAMCAHLDHAARGYRCACPSAAPVIGWATDALGVCRHFTAHEVPHANRR